MSKRHHGSSLDSFLKEEGGFEEAQALAIKEALLHPHSANHLHDARIVPGRCGNADPSNK
jgi:hypothetical protein